MEKRVKKVFTSLVYLLLNTAECRLFFVKHNVYKDKYTRVDILTRKFDNILSIRAHDTPIDLSF